jgi:two-component system, cell cycle response regulator DivK
MSEKPRDSTDKPLVLVADDFADTRDIVNEILTYGGFRVAEASSGPEALSRVRELLPAVVLMDLSLPGLDGWEVTRRLRQDPKTKHITIIALTAHARDEELMRAREAGCDDVITKPCEPHDILEMVRAKLAQRRGA